MPEHYYSPSPSSAHDTRVFAITYAGRTLRFETDAGVFSKDGLDHGTELLLSALPETFSGRALDLGCGWGAVGVCMGVKWPGATLVLTDINARAVELTQRNLTANQIDGQAVQGDGFENVAGAFDLIAINPPIRAGKSVVYRLFTESAARLSADGALYIVMRKRQGADSALVFLRTLFGDVTVVARGGGFRVFCARQTHEGL